MCAKKTNDGPSTAADGHRERLRQQFVADPTALTDGEHVELLLTFVIPRRDLAPLANSLLRRFGAVDGVFEASRDDLLAIDGLGAQALILVQVVGQILERSAPSGVPAAAAVAQLSPLSEGQSKAVDFGDTVAPKPVSMRVFVNDEIAGALEFLLQAACFGSATALSVYQEQRVAYNSLETRRRRAKYIVDGFLPELRLDTPLVGFAAGCAEAKDLGRALYYHLLRAVPRATALSDELTWLALPLGVADDPVPPAGPGICAGLADLGLRQPCALGL